MALAAGALAVTIQAGIMAVLWWVFLRDREKPAPPPVPRDESAVNKVEIGCG